MDVDVDTTERLLEIRDKIVSLDSPRWSEGQEACPSDIFKDYVANHELPMFLVDEDTVILYCNRAFQRFVNRPLQDILGSKGKDLYVYPVEFERFIQEVRIKGKVRGRKIHIKTADGPWPCLIYSSIRRIDGKWVNSRCLFVPLPKE